jgi:asparagine synthase (glutamine-hydrolysing)
LLGLKEKEILRRWATPLVPKSVSKRGKQPYRAPDAPSFFGAHTPEWVEHALAPATVKSLGYFAPEAVEGLVRRARRGQATGFRESQALVAILSTHALHHQVIDAAPPSPLDPARADVVLRETALN